MKTGIIPVKTGMDEIYTTTNGLQATEQEFIEMLDKYNLNEIHEFYYDLFSRELRDVLKPYFRDRMLRHLGFKK